MSSNAINEKYGDYFIGLDVGTGSCGWAVTDKSYNIIKIAGKGLWGVRLFPSATTAAQRRSQRSARRRIARVRQRLDLLELLFDSEISAVDKGFFQRLRCSELKGTKNTLFSDLTYKDKDFFLNYPTIYHLRKKLMTEPVNDVRLLFLGVHHIMKHRGHFLYDGLDLNNIGASLPEIWEICCSQFVDICLLDKLSDDFFEIFESLKQNLIEMREEVVKVIKSYQEKKDDIKKLISSLNPVYEEIADSEIRKDTANKVKSWLNLLLGHKKINASEIFNIEEFDENGCSCKLKFDSTDYDEQLQKISDEYKGVVESAKAVYDVIRLQEILKDNNSISEAKIQQYQKHSKELKIFKNLLINKLTKELLLAVNKKVTQNSKKKIDSFTDDPKCFFKEIFMDRTQNTEKDKCCFYYDLTHGDRNKNIEDVIKKSSIYSRLKVLSKMLLESKEIDLSNEEIDFLKRLENEQLPVFETQVSTENSVIPFQINKFELEQILNVQSKNFSFLLKKDSAGLTVADKVKSLFEFRIPYYVGPLNPHSKFSWIQKKKQEKILPWNFFDVVDKEKSAEEFIKRMTSKCTYLKREDVLPKNSIIYSKFMVLNVLNNIRINGLKLDDACTGLTKKIFEELYCNQANVTEKQLINYLYNNGYVTNKECSISGFDDDLKVSMSSLVKIKNVLETNNIDLNFAESLILYSTLFSNDYSMVSEKLHQKFPLECSKYKDKIDNLCKIKFSGWGKLSKKLLTGLIGNSKKSEFEKKNILDFMIEGKGNLMELLGSDYTFSDLILNENATLESNFTFSYKNLVEDLYVSPSVKRMIWQTLLVVREITKKIMGYEPSKIFIEMARGSSQSQKGKRTNSRKKALLDLYKNIKDEFYDSKEILDSLNERSDNELLNDKIYLYYTQLGRSMYTGEKIVLENLIKNSKQYDIDHVIPRSFMLDNSLDNRVLVEREINEVKGNKYPLSSEYIEKQTPFWRHLLKLGLITKSKFERLIRTAALSDKEKESFIARQLVETRQSTKAVASILSELYKDSKIIYPKATITADFKQKFDLIKVRELNDLHHAKDAYCNIVAGNVYYEKFTSRFKYVIENNERYSFSTSDKSYIFTNENEKRLQNLGVWDARDGQSISVVKKYYNRNNILMTYKQEERIGALFNQTLYGPGKATIPKKKGLSCKEYGGYDSDQNIFLSLISFKDKKSQIKYKFIGIPLRVVYGLSDKESAIKQYLITEKSDEYCDPKIIIECVPYNSILRNNKTGFLARITRTMNKGSRLGLIQFNSLLLSYHNHKSLKAIEKYVSRLKDKNSKIQYDKQRSGFLEEDLNSIYSELRDKVKNTVFRSLPEKILKILETIDISNYLYKQNSNSPELLTVEQKAYVICEIIKSFRTEESDLRYLGGNENSGVMSINSVLDLDKDDYSIIYYSITGFYEKSIRLRDLLK